MPYTSYLGHLDCAPAQPPDKQPGLGPNLSRFRICLSELHAVRLVADLLALSILWILGFASSQQIPDNGRGSSLLCNLLNQNRALEHREVPHEARNPLNPTSAPQGSPYTHSLLKRGTVTPFGDCVDDDLRV